ncbi:hypothetical protein E4U13_000124 [Claviceps humidiphila]|uniref:Uncharacterized protein n=1 Tax=Claviceps humidiphila TaxID=1294629 RepID=A0A9P7U1S9_9HYPO|nr:hypothetical protein E4U13_000124 [Claviceps humidiphila]
MNHDEANGDQAPKAYPGASVHDEGSPPRGPESYEEDSLQACQNTGRSSIVRKFATGATQAGRSRGTSRIPGRPGACPVADTKTFSVRTPHKTDLL